MKDPVEVIWKAHPNIERNRTLGIGRGREITDEKTADQILKLLDKLEEHDDVQNVYANFDISDDIMQKLEG